MPLPGEPPQRDVALWRGDNHPPIVWEFGDDSEPDLLAGSEFVLIVRWLGDEIERRSDDAGLSLDVAARTVTWPYTVADTLAIPRGPGPRYELRRLIDGTIQTWVWGQVIVRSGLSRG